MHKKAASIIDIISEEQLREWLRTIPYHIPEKQLDILVERAKLRKAKRVLWTDKDGFTFF